MPTVTITGGGYRLVRVEPYAVDSVLPFVEQILAKSIPYTAGFESVADMVAHMREGARRWQLWLAMDNEKPVGAFLSTLERQGEHMVFQFEVLASAETNKGEWVLELIFPLERYLQAIYNVTHTRIIGRPGWARFLKRAGYEAQSFISAKRLIPDALPGPDLPIEYSAPQITGKAG